MVSWLIGVELMKLKLLRYWAMWIFDHVPLGRLAPHVLGFAIGSKAKKVEKEVK